MMKKIVIATLMAATALGAVAPAVQAQGWTRDQGGEVRGPRGGDGGQRQAGQQQGRQPQAARQQWNESRSRPETPNGGNRTNVGRQGWTQPRVAAVPRQAQRDNRQAWQQDRQGDRRQWSQDRRDDRSGWAQNRRDDGARNRNDQDRRDWNRNDGNRSDRSRDNRRLDTRQRWADQHRWDNGWRNDRRYDWRDYRSRYGDIYRRGPYYAPRGWAYGYRSFSVGVFIDALLYSDNYWLDDPWSYRLPPAYGTLRWVRYYDDALLVDIRDGYVVDVIRNFFW
jgi:hypothetical protein